MNLSNTETCSIYAAFVSALTFLFVYWLFVFYYFRKFVSRSTPILHINFSFVFKKTHFPLSIIIADKITLWISKIFFIKKVGQLWRSQYIKSQYFSLWLVHANEEIFPSTIAYYTSISAIHYVTLICIITDCKKSDIFYLNLYTLEYNSPTTFGVESKILISLIIYWKYRRRTYRYGNKFQTKLC